VAALHVLFRCEQPPELRADTERSEESRGRPPDRHPLGAIRSLQSGGSGIERADALQALRLLQVVQLGDGKASLAAADSHESPVDGDEAALVAPAERTKQDGVHDAEDRGRGADAERQRDHRRGSEALRAPEAAQRETEIPKQLIHEVHSVRRAAIGSIRVARRAGMPLAASATTPSRAAIAT